MFAFPNIELAPPHGFSFIRFSILGLKATDVQGLQVMANYLKASRRARRTFFSGKSTKRRKRTSRWVRERGSSRLRAAHWIFGLDPAELTLLFRSCRPGGWLFAGPARILDSIFLCCTAIVNCCRAFGFYCMTIANTTQHFAFAGQQLRYAAQHFAFDGQQSRLLHSILLLLDSNCDCCAAFCF